MMDRVIERATRPAGRRPRRATVAVLVVGALVATACGGSDGAPTAEAATITPVTEAPTTTVAQTTTAATTTVAPTTVAPTTTTTTSTTTSTTTTSTAVPTSTTEPIVVTLPTTTLVAQPLARPVPPPADSYAREPIIEVGSIVIPKIGVDMTMYEGIRLSTLDYGPGHWPGTAMPGQPGNVVVGGHRTSGHRVFRNVDKLAAGDEIIFRADGQEHVYRVNRVEIVAPTAVWIVDPTETPTATLFACHPPGSTAQRIVVFADLVTT